MVEVRTTLAQSRDCQAVEVELGQNFPPRSPPSSVHPSPPRATPAPPSISHDNCALGYFGGARATASKFVIVARSCNTATTAPRPSFSTACIHRDRHDVGRNRREREEAGKQECLQACKEEVAAL